MVADLLSLTAAGVEVEGIAYGACSAERRRCCVVAVLRSLADYLVEPAGACRCELTALIDNTGDAVREG